MEVGRKEVKKRRQMATEQTQSNKSAKNKVK